MSEKGTRIAYTMPDLATVADVVNGARQWAILEGHVLERLADIPSKTVRTVPTSPPYYGLRAYGTNPQLWGGDPRCSHELTETAGAKLMTGGTGEASGKQITNAGSQYGNAFVETATGNARGATCTLCGAWRGELGSEPTVERFVGNIVQIFRELRRVMTDDGTLWLNMGDAYSGSGKGPTGHNGVGDQEQRQGFVSRGAGSVAYGSPDAKNLMLTPERTAFGLQGYAVVPGRWLLDIADRLAGGQDIAAVVLEMRERAAWTCALEAFTIRSHIWAKPGPMPESVTDRPTSAWEHVWLCAKRRRYYYDAEAIREDSDWPTSSGSFDGRQGGARDTAIAGGAGRVERWLPGQGRNARNVWFISHSGQPYDYCAGCRTLYIGDRRRMVLTAKVKTPAGKTRTVRKCPACLQTDKWLAHYASFPPDLPRRCILAGSQPGDIVLDPFSGSGTTVIEALNLGRRGIGIELQSDYADLSRQRIVGDAPMFSGL
jgi:DNA modification methylase